MQATTDQRHETPLVVHAASMYRSGAKRLRTAINCSDHAELPSDGTRTQTAAVSRLLRWVPEIARPLLQLGKRAATVLIILGGFLYSAQGGTVLVTSLADSGPGSLRAAIASSADGDTISFTVSGSIRLTSGELLITRNTTIAGPGTTHLAIDGNATSRLFRIGPSNVVTISGLTMRNGRVSGFVAGGAIYNDHSALTVSDCALVENSSEWIGGCIFNDGVFGEASLLLTNTILVRNGAGRGGCIGGGSAYGSLTMDIVNSIMTENSAGRGGCLYNSSGRGTATFRIVGSILSSNSAHDRGGAIENRSSLLGDLRCVVSNSLLAANVAGTGGGSIYNFPDDEGIITLEVVNSTFSGNASGSGNDGGGAAIFNDGWTGVAAVEIRNSTFNGNSGTAGGAIRNRTFFPGGPASVRILNSTLSDNSAGAGGAFWNNGVLEVLNCTLTGNSAIIGNTLLNLFGHMTIGSSILNADPGLENIYNRGSSTTPPGVINSLGYNLTSDHAGGFLAEPTDHVNANPMLGPLQDNGGTTFTHALLCGSPAVDQGKNFSASPIEQRAQGFIRTVDPAAIPNANSGDGTDIGAFEVQQPFADCDPLEALIALIESSSVVVHNRNSLIAILKAAAASVKNDRRTPALNQLRVFQNKVGTQIAPNEPVLARHLLERAQIIVDSIADPTLPH